MGPLEERIAPRVVPRACGGWLAVSPRWARFSVGVTGQTEEEARDRFHSVFARWVSLMEDTVQERT